MARFEEKMAALDIAGDGGGAGFDVSKLNKRNAQNDKRIPSTDARILTAAGN